MFGLIDVLAYFLLPVSILVLLCVAILFVRRYFKMAGRRTSSPSRAREDVAPSVPIDASQPHANPTAAPWRSVDAERIDVDVSVFAPKVVSPTEPFVIQAVIHRIGRQYEQAAQNLAYRLDHQAERLAQAPLIAQLQEGEHIELRLVAPDLDIEMPAQQIVWRGVEQVVAFIARMTKPGLTQALARLQVLCEGVPIGYAVFRVSCAPVEPATAKSGTNSETSFGEMSHAPANRPMRLVRYSRAFLSYSSNDRLHVLRHHQLLKLLGIEIFQDMVSLQPGEAWSETLLKKIDTADLILVYWSSSAASSEWVCKEVEYALSLRDKRGNDVPDIVPVILEGPPVPRPPPSIARVHFNDPMRYIIYAHEEATR